MKDNRTEFGASFYSTRSVKGIVRSFESKLWFCETGSVRLVLLRYCRCKTSM